MTHGSDLDPLDLTAGEAAADMALVPTLATKDARMAQFLEVAQRLPGLAQAAAAVTSGPPSQS